MRTNSRHFDVANHALAGVQTDKAWTVRESGAFTGVQALEQPEKRTVIA
jgi:hypothetical protein